MFASFSTRHVMVLLVALFVSGVVGPAAAQAPRRALSRRPLRCLMAKQIVEIKGVQNIFVPLVRGVVDKTRDMFMQTNFMWSKDLNEVTAIEEKKFAPRVSELVDATARIYATHFTEPELKQLLAFYQSPVGRKALVEEPKVVQESMASAGAWGDNLSAGSHWRHARGNEETRPRYVTRRSNMADHDVDLFVIGGGSGGVRAARIAAEHGARVMVAEEYRLGGTCVIRGCVPKKLLVYASRFRGEFEDAAGFGWTVSQTAFDWATLIANKDREIARLEAAYGATLNKAGVKVAKSRAVLVDAHTVQLATGDRVRAAYILIATGGAPSYGDPIPGIEHAITSNEAFHLPEFPRRVVIQGGGYIAVEFAGIFAGLGSQVTLVYRGENILRGFDDDVRQHLRVEMEAHGIRVLTGCKVAAIEKAGGHYSVRLSSGNSITADRVMFATGRHPNVAKLGLKEAGVEIGSDGGIAVDEYSRTTAANIYAVGDVTNRINLTPVAIREGHAFADTVFGGKPTAVDHSEVPTAVFSEPEVGTVGLTETQARAGLARTDVYKAVFKPLKATLSGRDTTVLMKLIVDGHSDRVVGCHVVGEGAAEMAQLAAVAIRMGAKKADFDATIALHPTAAEELVTMRKKTASFAREAAE